MQKYIFFILSIFIIASIGFAFPSDDQFCYCKQLNTMATNSDAVGAMYCQMEKMMYTFFGETLACFTGEEPKKGFIDVFGDAGEGDFDVPICTQTTTQMNGTWSGIRKEKGGVNTRTNDPKSVCKIIGPGPSNTNITVYGLKSKTITVDPETDTDHFYKVEEIIPVPVCGGACQYVSEYKIPRSYWTGNCLNAQETQDQGVLASDVLYVLGSSGESKIKVNNANFVPKGCLYLLKVENEQTTSNSFQIISKDGDNETVLYDSSNTQIANYFTNGCKTNLTNSCYVRGNDVMDKAGKIVATSGFDKYATLVNQSK